MNKLVMYKFIIIWVFSCFLRTDGGFAFAPWHAKKSEQKKNSAEKWSEKICQSMLRDESLRECEKLFITHGQLVSQWQNSLQFGIQIFRLTSHNWKMEEHGLMLQLKSSLLIALASARCQPWDRTTDLITIVSGQLWNEIEVTHPSHNEVTQPLRNLPHVHKGWVN